MVLRILLLLAAFSMFMYGKYEGYTIAVDIAIFFFVFLAFGIGRVGFSSSGEENRLKAQADLDYHRAVTLSIVENNRNPETFSNPAFQEMLKKRDAQEAVLLEKLKKAGGRESL